MLDGVPTDKYKQYKYTFDEDDVEVKASVDDSAFYIHGIKLTSPLIVTPTVARQKLMYVETELSPNEDNSQFDLKLYYKCTPNLSGISDVYLSFNLDGVTCHKQIGIRKKCGSSSSFAQIEIAEKGYWGTAKNILTDNGGLTIHPENLFDRANENVVIKRRTKELNFIVTNRNRPADDGSNDIEMDPPITKLMNEADQVIYPVLRGAGARRHVLKPGEYTEFKLEFN